MAHVFSVSELTTAIRDVLEIQFPFIWVRGQVSSLSRPGSGHIYFTLKDEQAGLQVVWFKNAHPFSRRNGSDPACTLDNGQDVLCAGRISVYSPRGTYQLIAELVQEQGLGDLFMAFEALKNKLQALGYFDQERKRAVPYSPDRVGIVTAPTGAVIHDFMRVAEDRGLGSRIRVYPSQVQGEKAPGELVRAIRLANRHGWAQVIVLIRGGGSLEDLWAFNDEQVARAIFESDIPVLTGIGHETDTTIADLVADRRVATPSQAAQVLWPQRKDMIMALDEREENLVKSYDRYLQVRFNSLELISKALGWLSPGNRLQRLDERLETLEKELLRQGRALWQDREDQLTVLESRLRARFGPDFWELKANDLDHLENRLKSSARNLVLQKSTRLELTQEKLTGLDPRGPLNRGYCLVAIERTGKYLRSVRDVLVEDALEITVMDGRVGSKVLNIVPKDRS